MCSPASRWTTTPCTPGCGRPNGARSTCRAASLPGTSGHWPSCSESCVLRGPRALRIVGGLYNVRTKMRIALAQTNPTIGDCDANAALLAARIDEAAGLAAELVVFP